MLTMVKINATVLNNAKFQCYLSTEDKRMFYEKCGYECCEPVLNAGSNTLLLKSCRLRKLFAPSEEKCKKVSSIS